MAEYMPDEVTDAIIAQLKMIPHHARWAHYKALKRNGRFPPEVSRVITENLKMLPHHFAYVKGAIGDRKMAKNPPERRRDMRQSRNRVIVSSDNMNKYWNFSTGTWGSLSKCTKFTPDEQHEFQYMPPGGKWSSIPGDPSERSAKGKKTKLVRNGLFDLFGEKAPKSVPEASRDQIKEQEEIIERLVSKMPERPTLDRVLNALLSRRMAVIVPHSKINSIISKVFDAKDADALYVRRNLEARERRIRGLAANPGKAVKMNPKRINYADLGTKEEVASFERRVKKHTGFKLSEIPVGDRADVIDEQILCTIRNVVVCTQGLECDPGKSHKLPKDFIVVKLD